MKLLDLLADAVAVHARQPAVDHITDVGHGQRRFRNVGRQDDATFGTGLEHLILFGCRQAREQRQYFDTPVMRIGEVMAAQGFRRVAYLALTRQEHQHIAAQAARRQLIQRCAHRFRHILSFAFIADLQRAITGLDRITAPRHLHHHRAEMPGEPVCIQRGGRDDEFQVRAARQQLFQVAQQKIDVQAAFVRLVDDDRVITSEQRIAVDFRQQNTVRHQLDHGISRDLVVETYLVADKTAELGFEFSGNAGGHRTGGHATRLGMADAAQHPAPQRQADFRQLRGLAGTCFAADNHHLIVGNRARQILPPCHHGQIGGKLNCG